MKRCAGSRPLRRDSSHAAQGSFRNNWPKLEYSRLMGHRVVLGALATATVLCGSGCGSSGGASPPATPPHHAYVLAPGGNQSIIPKAGVYLTIMTPFAIPASVLRTSNARVVAQAKGPQVCSYTKPIQGLPGKAASLNGKTVTLKVNGTNTFTTIMCSVLKKGRTFKPTSIGGN